MNQLILCILLTLSSPRVDDPPVVIFDDDLPPVVIFPSPPVVPPKPKPQPKEPPKVTPAAEKNEDVDVFTQPEKTFKRLFGIFKNHKNE